MSKSKPDTVIELLKQLKSKLDEDRLEAGTAETVKASEFKPDNFIELLKLLKGKPDEELGDWRGTADAFGEGVCLLDAVPARGRHQARSQARAHQQD